MIACIYDTPPAWANATFFNKNDVILQSNLYYYARENFTSHATQPFSFEVDSKWNGVTSVYGKTIPFFFWTPSYKAKVRNKPLIKKIQYGNGFEQVAPDGLNNQLITIELSFEQRDYNEYSAINHFLRIRGGTETFAFLPPPPYNKLKLFRCEEWDGDLEFIANGAVTTVFKEVCV